VGCTIKISYPWSVEEKQIPIVGEKKMVSFVHEHNLSPLADDSCSKWYTIRGVWQWIVFPSWRVRGCEIFMLRFLMSELIKNFDENTYPKRTIQDHARIIALSRSFKKKGEFENKIEVWRNDTHIWFYDGCHWMRYQYLKQSSVSKTKIDKVSRISREFPHKVLTVSSRYGTLV
jgi:hypothetical protein